MILKLTFLFNILNNDRKFILKNGAPNIFLDAVIECNGLHEPNWFCDTISPFLSQKVRITLEGVSFTS